MITSLIFPNGKTIGQYRVVRCIGQGGMGQVYEVEHIGLGVHYALKTFVFSKDGQDREDDSDAGRTTELLRTKFLEEGQLLARLKHPHLIHVFDLAIDEETQTPYYVMDLVLYKDGNPYTLDDVDREDLDEDFIFTWYKDACYALDYIHEQGVVHRDIKLENLLLTADKHLMLSDFGIAHIFGDGLVKDDVAQTTQCDSQGNRCVLYTPRYVAPEVESGEVPTAQADAYSLGVAIFKLLTGVWYEPGSDALSLLNGRKYRWTAVLPRLLAPTPDRRPKTLAATVAMLKAGFAEREASEKARRRAEKQRRQRLILTLSAIVGALFATGIGFCAYVYLLRGEDAADKVSVERGASERERQLELENAAGRKKLQASQELNAQYERELQEREAAERKEKERIAIEKSKRDAAARKAAEEKKRREMEARRKAEGKRRAEEKRKAEEATARTRAAASAVKLAPQRDYEWFGGGNGSPREIKFELLNGSALKFIPLVRPGADGPFWMSRLPISVGAWRDFRPEDFAELKPAESAISGDYELCAALDARQVEAYCEHLTAKYRLSLPKDFVFRPAKAEELSAAIAEEATRKRCERTGRDMEDCVGYSAAVRASRFRGFAAALSRHGAWNRFGISKDGKLLVAGLAMPYASGICDLSDPSAAVAWPHVVLARR